MEQSRANLTLLENSRSKYPHVHLVVVDTSRYPQLVYKHNASMMELQCYQQGKLVLSSKTSLLDTLDSFYQHVLPEYYNLSLGMTGQSSIEKQESFADQLATNRFGMVTITEAMKSEFDQLLQELSQQSEDLPSFKRSAEV